MTTHDRDAAQLRAGEELNSAHIVRLAKCVIALAIGLSLLGASVTAHLILGGCP